MSTKQSLSATDDPGVYDTNNRVYSLTNPPPGGSGGAVVQTSAPASPSTGALWYDTDETASGIIDSIPKGLVDAKGDLLVGSANDTLIRKAVGVNKQILSSDSVDSSGLTWVELDLSYLPGAWPKKSCRCATTANINLATGGLLTIDTIVTVVGDRVLVKDQTLPAANGIYVVTASGAWTRATDADSATKIAMSQVAVDSGATQAGLWRNAFKITDTLGTTAMPWAESYSDLNAPNTMERTQTPTANMTGVTVPAGESVEWSPDSKSLYMKAPDNTVTLIGPSAYAPPASTDVGYRMWRRKAADTSRISTTTLTADPDLTVPVLTGATYSFDLFLIWVSTVFTSDIQFTFIHPGGTLNFGGSGPHNAIAAGSSGDAEWVQRITVASNTNATPYAGGVVPYGARITGNFVCTTSGTFALSWAQLASIATATLLKAGSHMTVIREV